jgi:hypothetical protein
VCTGVNRLRIAAASRSPNEHENEESRRGGPEAGDHSVPSCRWASGSHAMSTGQRPGGFRVGAGYRSVVLGHRCPCSGSEPCCLDGSARSDLRSRRTTFGVACRATGGGSFAAAPAGTGHGSPEGRRLSLLGQRGSRERAFTRALGAGERIDVGGSANCGKALWNVWVTPTCRPKGGGAGGEAATENRPDLPLRARAPVVPAPWRGSAVRPI